MTSTTGKTHRVDDPHAYRRGWDDGTIAERERIRQLCKMYQPIVMLANVHISGLDVRDFADLLGDPGSHKDTPQ